MSLGDFNGIVLNQVEGISSEPVFVASKPVYNSDKIPFVFPVDLVDRRIDLANASKPGKRGWTENDEFLFVIPR